MLAGKRKKVWVNVKRKMVIVDNLFVTVFVKICLIAPVDLMVTMATAFLPLILITNYCYGYGYSIFAIKNY